MRPVMKHIKGIGDVKMVKSQNPRAKYINITIKPFDGVIVTIPRHATYHEAEIFVNKKIGWIQKKVSKMQSIEHKKTIFDENTNFSTKYNKLKITPRQDADPRVHVDCKQGILNIQYPKNTDVRSEKIQTIIRQTIEEIWRREANIYLKQRVQELAQKYGFRYNRVTIKNIRSRWGSCSHQNNINLTLHLMYLPQHLQDYIILHELAHTVEKNHGPEFWGLLDTILGDAKKIDKEMKKYRIGIY